VTPVRKKLIEVSIPLEAINAASKKQKAPKGYPTAIHKYWAQRPVSACRGILLAQLVDDPSAWPDRFPSEEAQDAERRRLHKVIEAVVPWEASNDQAVLSAARWEIARSIAWSLGEEPPPREDGKAILDYLQAKGPPIYDPFSGGGSIPLEAQRLGLRAYGSDLNPVAVLIGKALVEIPPKFAGLPPVNPEAQAELRRGGCWNGKGAQGLAEDVRYFGRLLREKAEQRVGQFYPKTKLPDGTEATVIAWLWARTVRSPDPAAKGAMVPLVSSFMLSTKEGRKSWVNPVLDQTAKQGWRFEVHQGALNKDTEEKLKLGTKAGKGQAFTCVLTGSPIDRKYIQEEGKANRLGQRLMAIVAEAPKGRLYLPPTQGHEDVAVHLEENEKVQEARESFLSPTTPTRAMITGGVCSAYGLRTYGHLFTARQILALTTFADLVSEIRNEVLTHASIQINGSDPKPLREGGVGASAYADAIATYLSFIVSRAADYGSSIATWLTEDNAIRGTFGRQALPMTWDFCEGNFFGDSSAALDTILRTVPDVIAHQNATVAASILELDAAKNGYPERPCVINTDPPYYDNIAYADLSDFFYVWLRRSSSSIWPDLFRRISAPKNDELIATTFRHGSKSAAEAYFMAGMGRALSAMRAAASDGEPLIIYYAFKQAEAAHDGITSAGWATFLQAIADAGLAVDGTWPLRTESAGRLIGRGANALASSIVLVCRKRPVDAPLMSRADFVRTLKRELPDAIDAIRKAGVGPVDMQQSVIGPGMGVFSRHAKILEDDDSAMSVKTALTVINRVWEEIENELDAAFDPETQVALAWYASYAFDARSSGELIMLTTAKNTSDRALFASGVFEDRKGKAALTGRDALPKNWTPADDRTLTIWECVQHTARVLNAADGGTEAAARLVAQMGSASSDARKLAYRLFEIATQKGWSAEALVYNELAEVWPKLEDIASNTDLLAASGQPPQRSLFEMGA